jgi:DNA-binding transcriptional ArsR family regulator
LRRAGLVATRREGVWIYYRLAESRDPVRQALFIALGHAQTVRRDVDRLQKKCGC